MSDVIREPTAEECSANTLLWERDGVRAYACWYPQMGGYVGKAVVEVWPTDSNVCFEVSVWHDGEFPFGEDTAPARLHHCEAEQFIRFGQLVQRLQGVGGRG